MNSQSCYDSWKCIKYKELKRGDRTVTGNIVVGHDPSRKTLYVYHEGQEIDRVVYNMDVSRYPLLKLDSKNLFVRFNEIGQGFRLTFENEQQKVTFSKTMQNLTYISESPLKTFSQDKSSMFDGWQKPTKVRYGSHPGPSKQLHMSMSQPVFNPYSQPVYNPYTKPADDFHDSPQASSVQFPISHGSPAYSMMSGSGANTWGSQQSDISSNPFSSNLSQATFTPPMPVVNPVRKVDKSTQTESWLQSTNFDGVSIVESFEKMKNDERFIELVKYLRKELENGGALKVLVDEISKSIENEEEETSKSPDPFEYIEERHPPVDRRRSQRLAEIRTSSSKTSKRTPIKLNSRRSSKSSNDPVPRPKYKRAIDKYSETQ